MAHCSVKGTTKLRWNEDIYAKLIISGQRNVRDQKDNGRFFPPDDSNFPFGPLAALAIMRVVDSYADL